MGHKQDKTLDARAVSDRLRQSLLREDVSEKACQSLLLHLADLKRLAAHEDGRWGMLSCPPQETTGEDEWIAGLIELCRHPEGFALKYFVRELPEDVSLVWPDPKGYEGKVSDGLLEGEDRSVPKKSSNLSNLQIVKKVGRQLSPLIEMENHFLEKLQGPRVSRQNARVLFNYIIGRIKMKGEPREWTQLSRRRHK